MRVSYVMVVCEWHVSNENDRWRECVDKWEREIVIFMAERFTEFVHTSAEKFLRPCGRCIQFFFFCVCETVFSRLWVLTKPLLKRTNNIHLFFWFEKSDRTVLFFSSCWCDSTSNFLINIGEVASKQNLFALNGGFNWKRNTIMYVYCSIE